MTDRSTLSMWTVFDHPTDYPRHFVARRSAITAGQVVITDEVMAFENLETLRANLEMRGLTKLMRHPDDDPKIMEVWL